MILPFNTRNNIKGTHYIFRKKQEKGLADANAKSFTDSTRWVFSSITAVQWRYMASTFSNAYSVQRAIFLYSFLVFDFKSPGAYYTSTFLVRPLYHAKLIIRPSIHWIKRVLEEECWCCISHWFHRLQTFKSPYNAKDRF